MVDEVLEQVGEVGEHVGEVVQQVDYVSKFVEQFVTLGCKTGCSKKALSSPSKQP